jgi:hypothetical protein
LERPRGVDSVDVRVLGAGERVEQFDRVLTAVSGAGPGAVRRELEDLSLLATAITSGLLWASDLHKSDLMYRLSA